MLLKLFSNYVWNPEFKNIYFLKLWIKNWYDEKRSQFQIKPLQTTYNLNRNLISGHVINLLVGLSSICYKLVQLIVELGNSKLLDSKLLLDSQPFNNGKLANSFNNLLFI